MVPSSQALTCQKGCLLEGVLLDQLPPYIIYRWDGQITSRKEGGIFLICRGPVGCYFGEPDRCCLEVLGPGDLWEGWQECEAWALGEVHGRWFELAHWLVLLQQPEVQERLSRHNRERVERTHNWQVVLAHGSVRARVAWQTVDLAERFGERDERTQEIFVPVHLTQTDEAALVGASRAQVGKALREFEGKRWLVWGPRGFWVRDLEALRIQSREEL